MTATVHLGRGMSLHIDAVQGTPAAPTRGVLLTLEYPGHGKLLDCGLIPIDRVGAVIESIRLAAG